MPLAIILNVCDWADAFFVSFTVLSKFNLKGTVLRSLGTVDSILAPSLLLSLFSSGDSMCFNMSVLMRPGELLSPLLLGRCFNTKRRQFVFTYSGELVSSLNLGDRPSKRLSWKDFPHKINKERQYMLKKKQHELTLAFFKGKTFSFELCDMSTFFWGSNRAFSSLGSVADIEGELVLIFGSSPTRCGASPNGSVVSSARLGAACCSGGGNILIEKMARNAQIKGSRLGILTTAGVVVVGGRNWRWVEMSCQHCRTDQSCRYYQKVRQVY